MTDRINEPMDLIVHRANLLYLLQTFSRVAEDQDRDIGARSNLLDEQGAQYKRNDGLDV